jgi:tetratricopeptide (TPR) repeat protein
MTDALADRAREALRLAEADPGQSADLAALVADQARSAGDYAAAAIAERALGLATLHIEDADAAMAHLRAAITLGGRAGAPQLTAEARMTLAYVLNGSGRSRPALKEIDMAIRDLVGLELVRAEAQRGAILQLLGRFDEALASYREALPTLRRADDHVWVQRVLANRCIIYGYRHQLAAAKKDLREAGDLCDLLDLGLSAGFVQQNLGWINTIGGDVPAALHHLDLAEQRFRALGSRLGFILCDRSELLLSVRLISEARQTAEQAVRQIEREGQQIALPEARLMLARAALLGGDNRHAVEQARRAVGEFTSQQRPYWATLARYVLLVSRLEDGDRRHVTVRQLAAVAHGLAATGWTAATLEARLLVGQLAIERGSVENGRHALEQVSQSRRRGPALLRSRAWYGEALLRLADGNAAGARKAVRSGLRVLDEHRACMGATDLRANAAGHRSELAALGLRIAMTEGRPSFVLAWAEQSRARHLLSRPAHQPDDPELAAALARLRGTVREIEELHKTGGRSAVLDRRQAALERQIRDHCRRQPRAAATEPAPAVTVTQLAGALGQAALVEYFHLDTELHAVVLVNGRARLVHIGPLEPARDAVEFAAFAVRRLARRKVSDGSRSAAVAMLRHSAASLDAMLLEPFARLIENRPLVVVPTGPLQSLPWSILPSCAGRPVTVAPSAALWYAAECGGQHWQGRVAVVAGPGLAGARIEAEAVAAIYRTTALIGAAATVPTVTSALNRADLVHLAAHGRVRADNPLFSSLRLADGPLTIYDLERLDRVAPVVIAAACESGRSVVCAGDEILGFSATLLSLGTEQLIAPVVPIPDAETAPLMIAFHRQLAAGRPIAEALSHAQQQMAAGTTDAMAAAAAFICIGAGLKAPVPG